MLVTPPQGWHQFNHGDDVIELIADSLKLEDCDGIWQYYNFTENSSVWCSDEVEATNQLQITFESDHSNAMIKSLGIELTNNSSTYFKQLYRLKKKLKTEFDIRD